MEIHILTWVMDIFFIFTLHILYKKVLGVKYKKKHIIFWDWSCYFVLWNISSYIFVERPILNGTFSLLFNFLILLFLYKGNLRFKFILVLVVVVLGVIAETLVTFIFMALGINIIEEGRNNNDYLYFASAVSKIFWFIFVKLIAIISRKNKQVKVRLIEWMEVFLVPIGSLIIFYIVVWDNFFNITISKLIVFIVLFLINILTYYIYQVIQLHSEELLDRELIKQQNDYYKARYEDTQKQWNKLRKIKHDMKNNYVLELGYLEEGKYEELRNFYNEAIGNLASQEIIIDTGNIGIDSIINYKVELAKELSISVRKEVHVEGDINISNEDLNILLGNLFDNAIEAVSKLEESKRQIFFKLHSDKTAMFFQINNNFNGTLKKDYKNEIVTTKEDKESHGLGLKSIKEIVKRYEGKIDIEQRDNQFEVKVFLYM